MTQLKAPVGGVVPLPELEAALPPSVTMEILADRTTGIRASVHHVQIELVLAVVMVVLVIFAFLGSLRATVIASLAEHPERHTFAMRLPGSGTSTSSAPLR